METRSLLKVDQPVWVMTSEGVRGAYITGLSGSDVHLAIDGGEVKVHTNFVHVRYRDAYGSPKPVGDACPLRNVSRPMQTGTLSYN